MNKEISDYIKEEVKRLFEEEQFKQTNTNQYMDNNYGRVRNEYNEQIRKVSKSSSVRTWKIVDAIRDIAKADSNISYMSKATNEQLNEMAKVYEVMAKAYLYYKETVNLPRISGDSIKFEKCEKLK